MYHVKHCDVYYDVKRTKEEANDRKKIYNTVAWHEQRNGAKKMQNKVFFLNFFSFLDVFGVLRWLNFIVTLVLCAA